MRFAVIMPVFNEAVNLPRTLPAVMRACESVDAEIFVIDNQSTDASAEIAASFGVRVIKPAAKVNISELRNIGAAATDADILAFLDADMEPPANWLRLAAAEFEDPSLAGLGFVEDTPDEAPWYAKIWSRRTLARRAGRKLIDFLPGRNICVRRHVFESVGGFSAQLMTSEDKDFVMRCAGKGARFYSLPPIGLKHWGYERSFAEWVRKEFWRQRSHLAMIARHGASLRLLRFPILSVAHVAGGGALAAACVIDTRAFALSPLLLSPSLAMSLAKDESRKGLSDIAAFTALYYLRFNIAGAAVISEAIADIWEKRDVRA